MFPPPPKLAGGGDFPPPISGAHGTMEFIIHRLTTFSVGVSPSFLIVPTHCAFILVSAVINMSNNKQSYQSRGGGL